jgi:hypothetical protein
MSALERKKKDTDSKAFAVGFPPFPLRSSTSTANGRQGRKREPKSSLIWCAADAPFPEKTGRCIQMPLSPLPVPVPVKHCPSYPPSHEKRIKTTRRVGRDVCSSVPPRCQQQKQKQVKAVVRCPICSVKNVSCAFLRHAQNAHCPLSGLLLRHIGGTRHGERRGGIGLIAA